MQLFFFFKSETPTVAIIDPLREIYGYGTIYTDLAGNLQKFPVNLYESLHNEESNVFASVQDTHSSTIYPDITNLAARYCNFE